MAWEILEIGIRQGEPKISLTRAKTIRFNSEFIRKNKINKKKFVRIYVDEKDNYNLVGFKFIEEKREKTLKLSEIQGNRGLFCSGNSLFKRLKINVKRMDKSMNFSPVEENMEDGKIFVIKIQKEYS